MIDTDKYEGHTEGKWNIDVNCNLVVNNDEVIGTVEIYFPERPTDEADSNGYETSMNYKLIADAPLLLAEVKRLRKQVVALLHENERLEAMYHMDVHGDDTLAKLLERKK